MEEEVRHLLRGATAAPVIEDLGQANGPAPYASLSGKQILLIINWITSLWPDEIYDAWSKRN